MAPTFSILAAHLRDPIIYQERCTLRARHRIRYSRFPDQPAEAGEHLRNEIRLVACKRVYTFHFRFVRNRRTVSSGSVVCFRTRRR